MKEKIIYIGKSTEAGMIEENLSHAVYDLRIENIEERKEKRKIFDNANQVADYLGVKIDIIFKNRFPKKTVIAINGKEYAVRTIPK